MLTNKVIAKTVKFAAIAILTINSSLLAWDSEENEFWLTTAAQTKVYDKWKLKLSEQTRWTDGEVERYTTDLTAAYKINKSFSVGIGSQYIRKSFNNGWHTAWKSHLNLSYSIKLKPVKIQNRTRLGYYINMPDKNDWGTLEDKIEISPANFKLFNRLTPYISGEYLYNLDENFYYRHREYAGFKSEILKNLNINCFLMRQVSRKEDNDWTEKFITGAGFRYDF